MGEFRDDEGEHKRRLLEKRWEQIDNYGPTDPMSDLIHFARDAKRLGGDPDEIARRARLRRSQVDRL